VGVIYAQYGEDAKVSLCHTLNRGDSQDSGRFHRILEMKAVDTKGVTEMRGVRVIRYCRIR
jgi:hypothetical protein